MRRGAASFPLTDMQIGPYALPSALFLAPMAGVTDAPFRQVCRHFGAGHAVCEMVAARADLRTSALCQRRMAAEGEPPPLAVQLVGAEPQAMADAARAVIDQGAHIVDINMGCPSRRVCRQWAGSALMRDEALALAIIRAVVAACAPHGVPVTLKMRTGWSAAHRNALRLARAAESEGVQMLTLHGRTRDQGWGEAARYDTIAEVKAALRIPVVANGDIDAPEKAREVLHATGADALMIGRAAWGRPWLFREVAHFLATGRKLAPPLVLEVRRVVLEHMQAHYALHGEARGVRSARGHIVRYVRGLPGAQALLERLRTVDDAITQWTMLDNYWSALAERHERLPLPQVQQGAGVQCQSAASGSAQT